MDLVEDLVDRILRSKYIGRSGQRPDGRFRRDTGFVEEERRVRLCVGLSKGGLHLSRKHEELPPRFHDHLPHITARRCDDFHRLALGGTPHFITKTRELVGLGNPGIPPQPVALDQVWYWRIAGLRLVVLSRHDYGLLPSCSLTPQVDLVWST